MKTWEEKQQENQAVYDAAREIIDSWPEWKRQWVAERADPEDLALLLDFIL